MRKIAALTVIGLFLTALGSATTISSESIIVDLGENSVEAQLNVKELTTETFNYQTSHPIRNLDVTIAGKKANCSVEELAVGETVNCETDLKKNFTVKINYNTDSLVSEREGIKVFRYSQSIYRPIQDYSFKVILPEGTGVVDQESANTKIIVPEGGEVGNMDGRRFSVKWTTEPDLGESQSFRVLFEPFENPANRYYIPESILALAVILALAYFAYKRKNKVTASNIIEELGEDEKMVVEMLRESEGEMLQKDIVNDSEYSKAKISGVVSELVDGGIVTKEKEGRSNKVSLKKKYRN